ncbi:hypothetical protein LX87_04123 [Larkinella arboricola]|uniref:Uncharacterized protein n=1 Tax=Larkinella arboricola TaxID=643671 RepID=A0A327WPE8_LARAB|nr:hypothetical protein [Larkinella arboricola]RAJ94238.1 hypothetical protein LX87_04123 [Larkinella arboricola]
MNHEAGLSEVMDLDEKTKNDRLRELKGEFKRKARGIRLWTIICLLIVILAVFYYSAYFIFNGKYAFNIFIKNQELYYAFNLVFLLIVLVSLGCLMYLYLINRELVKDYQDNTDQINLKFNRVRDTNSMFVLNDNHIELFNDENQFSQKAKTPLHDPLRDKISYIDIIEGCALSKVRIEKEINKLGSRANVNLVIGSVSTILGVGVLVWSTFGISPGSTIQVVLPTFLPRLFIAIFIEVFSFFFLRLYRNTLVDIKYYHNELTNIDFKVLSLKTTLFKDNDPLLIHVIQEFVKTERNFILKSDEATLITILNKLENERDKNSSDSIKIAIESLQKYFNKDTK